MEKSVLKEIWPLRHEIKSDRMQSNPIYHEKNWLIKVELKF